MKATYFELFAKLIFFIVNVQKCFDDVGKADCQSVSIDNGDVVFGVGPNSFFGDVCDIRHQFCEYFGLGTGDYEIVHKLTPSDCVPVHHDRVGDSRLAAERRSVPRFGGRVFLSFWLKLGFSVNYCLGPIESFGEENVGEAQRYSAVFVEQRESQQFVNGNADAAPLMRFLNPFLSLF